MHFKFTYHGYSSIIKKSYFNNFEFLLPLTLFYVISFLLVFEINIFVYESQFEQFRFSSII